MLRSIAFESPSLSGLWPATDAGFGIVLRARFGKPENVQSQAPEEHALPRLPSLGWFCIIPTMPQV